MLTNMFSDTIRKSSETERLFEEFLRDRGLYVKWCRAIRASWLPPEKIFDNMPVKQWLIDPVGSAKNWKDINSGWLMYLTIMDIKD